MQSVELELYQQAYEICLEDGLTPTDKRIAHLINLPEARVAELRRISKQLEISAVSA